MPVVDRRVDRLSHLKHAILTATSLEEGQAYQAEFDTICAEQRRTFAELYALASHGWGWKQPAVLPSAAHASL